jgi:hypothetical protein
MKIGGGLIERKHLEKWIKRLKIKNNMDILPSWVWVKTSAAPVKVRELLGSIGFEKMYRL